MMIRAVDEALRALLREELSGLPTGIPGIVLALPPEDLPNQEAVLSLLEQLVARSAEGLQPPNPTLRGAPAGALLPGTLAGLETAEGPGDAGAVHLFLYRMEENLLLREQGRAVERDLTSGRALVHRPPVYVDLHYAVTVTAASPDREHSLLAETFAALLRHGMLDVSRWVPRGSQAADLVAQLRSREPFPMKLAHPDAIADPVRFWQALGRKPRALFSLIVTATLEPHAPRNPPLVTRTSAGLAGSSGPEERPLHWVSVAGTVLDQDQQGLAGVRISVPGHPYSAVSDARGFYCLLNMPAGEYAIRAAEDRCAPVTKTVRVLGESAPHYVPENFELVEAALTGVVRRVPNAQPVPNVLVRAGAEETTTDLEGGFAFLQLPVGPVELAIAVPGFLPQRRTIQIEPEPQAGKQRDRDPAEIAPPRIPRVEFLLFPAALSGRVSDRHTGAPIANAQVELMDGTRLVTGPRGEFGLEHLPEGPHRIVVSAPSYRTYEHLFTLRSNRGVAGSAVLPIALQAEVPHQDRPEPEAPQETAGTARGGKRRRVGE